MLCLLSFAFAASARKQGSRPQVKFPLPRASSFASPQVKVGSCRLDSSGAQLSREMDYLEKAKRVFDTEIRELQRLRERLGDDFSRAVALIKDAVDARGKVVVVGVGKSGHVGAKIASTLTSTGSPAVVLDSLNALH